jgi:hypothetical protein
MSILEIEKCATQQWALFHGMICTANADGAIPLNSKLVMDCREQPEHEARRIVLIHNALLIEYTEKTA